MINLKKEAILNWHADFRTVATLPDVRPIRIKFILNSVSCLFLTIFAGILGYQEYRILSERSLQGDLSNFIQTKEPNNKLFLQQSERFRKASFHFVEIEQFYDTPFLPHHLILELAKLKPSNLAFKSINYSEKIEKKKPKSAMNYIIVINGEARGLKALSEFKKNLQESEFMKVINHETKIKDSNFGRNPETNIFSVQMDIEIIPMKSN